MPLTETAQQALQALGVELREFVPSAASEAEWQAFLSVGNQEDKEEKPDDPPTTLDDLKKSLLNMPSFVKFTGWLAFRGATPIATMFAGYMLTEENQHLMQFDLYLVPDERRKGVGSRLLHWVVDLAQANNRRLLITDTSSMIPAGDAFMEKLGGEMALSGDESQLLVDELDIDLMDQWLERANERGGDLTLGIWEGLYPEDELEAIAELKRTMNTAPRDDLDMEDFNFTAEHLREAEKAFAARDRKRWTYYVRDPENNTLAGYTELYWNPSKPLILSQGDTAVVPAYRNRGIGRWVKAAAIKGVLAEQPGVKYVRTDNASSNAGMLKINHEMGFKLYKVSKHWQIETAKMNAYLESR